MLNKVQSILLDKLVAHPDNPNRMSKTKFAKLLRNIERTGRYEPLVVRTCPQKSDCFQIINGHHRWRALRELGYKTAETLVWDVNDQETDILLVTLNRLGGSDVFDKKLTLLKRLNKSAFEGRTTRLAKLLPQTANQIKRLTELTISDCQKAVENHKSQLLNPLVFFLNDKQQEVVAKALSAAMNEVEENRTKALKNAAALTYIAQEFINSRKVGP
ncbi:MAG: ParB/RepB/Spo0J family partition protein [Sedimentisphaerales bacterium]|nr:ParB/RepB/Spo0J family partition protein [Sedimentisphaerales bacterium]